MEFNPGILDLILEKAFNHLMAEAARRARELVRRKSVLESSTCLANWQIAVLETPRIRDLYRWEVPLEVHKTRKRQKLQLFASRGKILILKKLMILKYIKIQELIINNSLRIRDKRRRV